MRRRQLSRRDLSLDSSFACRQGVLHHPIGKLPRSQERIDHPLHPTRNRFVAIVVVGAVDVPNAVKRADEARAHATSIQNSLEDLDRRLDKVRPLLREEHRAFEMVHIPDHVDRSVDFNRLTEIGIRVGPPTTTDAVEEVGVHDCDRSNTTGLKVRRHSLRPNLADEPGATSEDEPGRRRDLVVGVPIGNESRFVEEPSEVFSQDGSIEPQKPQFTVINRFRWVIRSARKVRAPLGEAVVDPVVVVGRGGSAHQWALLDRWKLVGTGSVQEAA